MRRAAAAMGLSVCLAACGTGSGGANPAVPDAAMPDAAMPDAAVPDAAVPDAAVPDAAPVDAAPDASPLPPLGGDRPARVILPSEWTPNQPWPLVVLLHGFRANGTLVDNQFGFSRQVEA
jgi:poly(3-hydroxybutyrate) depolymerase